MSAAHTVCTKRWGKKETDKGQRHDGRQFHQTKKKKQSVCVCVCVCVRVCVWRRRRGICLHCAQRTLSGERGGEGGKGERGKRREEKGQSWRGAATRHFNPRNSRRSSGAQATMYVRVCACVCVCVVCVEYEHSCIVRECFSQKERERERERSAFAFRLNLPLSSLRTHAAAEELSWQSPYAL